MSKEIMWFSSAFDEQRPVTSVISNSYQYGLNMTNCGELQKQTVNSSKKAIKHKIDRQEGGSGCSVVQGGISGKKMERSLLKVGNYMENECSSMLFADRFSPTRTEDLAVHKKKVAEVKQWIIGHSQKNKQSKILFLIGPCGSGKTATIKSLCNEMNIELIEWESPVQYDLFRADTGDENIYEKSQAEIFIEFLNSSSRASLHNLHSKKMLFVEFLPNLFYCEVDQFHSILREWTRTCKCMLVFGLSTTGSWYLNPHRLLSAAIVQECNIDIITFNPCALTFIVKALKRIISTAKLAIAPQNVKCIGELANGDVRLAVNNLQFYSNGEDKLISECDRFTVDFSYDFFHCIGKLMYAKRKQEKCDKWLRIESTLNPSLTRLHHRPYPPKDDINAIIDQLSLSCENLLFFVQEHEPNFAASLSALRSVLEDISFADFVFCNRNHEAIKISTYHIEMVTRSAIFHNYGCEARKGRGLYMFHKPKYFNIESQMKVFKQECKVAFRSGFSGDFFSLIVPFLSKVHKSFDFQHSKNYSSKEIAELNDLVEDTFDIEEIDI